MGDSSRVANFVVSHVRDESVVLVEVASGETITVEAESEFERGTLIEARIAPLSPSQERWEILEKETERVIDIEASAQAPTRQAKEAARGGQSGQRRRIDRAGTGELHVLIVPPGSVSATVDRLLSNEPQVCRKAGQLSVGRVEIRWETIEHSTEEAGVVSIRYLP